MKTECVYVCMGFVLYVIGAVFSPQKLSFKEEVGLVFLLIGVFIIGFGTGVLDTKEKTETGKLLMTIKGGE